MILAIIFALFAFFTSPLGLATIGLGTVTFFGLPVISKATSWKGPSQFMFWLAKLPISRVAFVLSEHGDIIFKQMQFNARGVEVINLDGTDKDFEDPDNALHYWLGLRFGLADEKHGVLFDPRHAAAGARKQEHIEQEEYEYTATEEEWEQRDISKWVRAVYEFPRNTYELVDLSAVRHLVDGGERSEYAHRVEELYKHSRDPYDDGAQVMKFFYPIIAFIVIFGGFWFMSDQFGSPQGGSTISYGLLALMAAPLANSRVPVKRIAGALTTLALIAVYVFALFTLSGLVGVIGGVLGFLIGFGCLPVFAFIFQVSEKISGALSTLFFKLGFLGYRRPVFEWTPEAYRLREYDDLEETTADPVWYGAFGNLVGFTFTPGESSWGAEWMDNEKVEAQQVEEDVKSRVPSKRFAKTDIQRDDMAGFVPSRIKSACYYLHSGILQSRFKHSANGEKAQKRLLEAKEKHGEGKGGLGDTTVLYLTAASGLLAVLMGVFFFLL